MFGRKKESALESSGNTEIWAPKGAVAVSKSSDALPLRFYAPPGSSWPPLELTPANLATTQFILDGTFESDAPEDEVKVRKLAREAFLEYADRVGVSGEELEAQAKNYPQSPGSV